MEELLKAIGHCEQEAELCVQNGKSFGVERPVVVDDLDLLLLQKPNQVVAQC